ncbi:MAG: FAD-binding oxidoreductase [Proteobacteria bacterium]|nr:FAD-binding oxidoreductase [Pseudomonadota bacterium]
MDTAVIDGLKAIVGPGGWIDDPAEMEPYVTEQRGMWRGVTPLVVRPKSTGEVARIVQLCARNATPIVPQAGNTGLCGGAVPHGDGREILLSVSRMNKVRGIAPLENTITVEAGCILADVQAAADDAGRLFPLSLAAEGSCQIGGNLSTNAGGTGVLRYGSARDLVLGLEVVLPDGRVWDGLRHLRKDNTGYDLKHLFIGAEGTLGIITAAVLKLFPRPAEFKTALVALPDVPQALELLVKLREGAGDRVSAFELMPHALIDLVVQNFPDIASPFAAVYPWYVLVEISAASGQDAATQGAILESSLADAMESGLARDAVVAQSEAQRRALWKIRETAPEAQKFLGASIKHDISVPLSAIASFIERAGAATEKVVPGARVLAFGHVGDGNVHFNVSEPPGTGGGAFLEQIAAVNHAVYEIAADLGGSISAEHGLGQLKREAVRRYKTDIEMELMQRVKDALDPQGIMNPGKVL